MRTIKFNYMHSLGSRKESETKNNILMGTHSNKNIINCLKIFPLKAIIVLRTKRFQKKISFHYNGGVKNE